jgi:hypothetical protein
MTLDDISPMVVLYLKQKNCNDWKIKSDEKVQEKTIYKSVASFL